VAQALESRGVEGYLPVYRSRYRSAGRFQDVDLPLFPQYVFCRLGAWSHAHILSTPGVFRFVAFGSNLAPVDDLQLQNLRRVIATERELQPWPFLNEGDLVEIAEGPLRSMTGRLIMLDGDCQLVLEISLLGRSVAVKIERGWVRPVSMALSSPLSSRVRSPAALTAPGFPFAPRPLLSGGSGTGSCATVRSY